MPETLGTRVKRLEEAMIRLTNAQAHLTEVQAQDETEIRGVKLRIEELKREALERERRLDERIEKLVSAIGEFIRKNGQSPGNA